MHALDAGGGCEAVLLQLQLTRRGTGDAGLTRRAFLVCRVPHYILDIGFLWTETRHNTAMLLSTSRRRLRARRCTPVPQVPAPVPPAPPSRRCHAAAASDDEISDAHGSLRTPRRFVPPQSNYSNYPNAKAESESERESELESEGSGEGESDDEDDESDGEDSESGGESAQEELAA